MTTYAQITIRQEYLFNPESEALARRLFGDATVDSLPRFVRGKHKGSVKGMLTYKRVVKGGWVRTGPSTTYGPEGYVETRVDRIISAEIGTLEWGKEPTVLHRWELSKKEVAA